MQGPGSSPTSTAGAPYLASHIKEALATDERTHLLDVIVEVTGTAVFLQGNVSTEHRRSAAEEVVRELLGTEMQIINALCVELYREPGQTEPLD